jgi:prevent-host-death family protein
MTKLAATALRADFSGTLNRVAFQGERVALERHGKTIAALVSADDLQLLEALEDRADLAAVRRALKEGGRPEPWEKVKAELGL